MKKITSSFFIGLIVAALIVFLIGIDLKAVRHNNYSGLLNFDKKKQNVTKDDSFSDIQILSLIDKRIRKLENNIEELNNKLNTKKNQNVTEKLIPDGDSKKSTISKLSDVFREYGNNENDKNELIIKPSNKKSQITLIPIQPIPTKAVFNKSFNDLPTKLISTPIPIKESIINPFSKQENSIISKIKKSEHQETPEFLTDLLDSFHKQLLSLANNYENDINNSRRVGKNKFALSNKNDVLNLAQNISNKEVIDLSPSTVIPKNDTKNKDIKKTNETKNKPIIDHTFKKMSNKDDLKKLLDTNSSPFDNVVNLTDFNDNKNELTNDFHPLFFDKKINIPEYKKYDELHESKKSSSPVIDLSNPIEPTKTENMKKNKSKIESSKVAENTKTSENKNKITDLVKSVDNSQNENELFNINRKNINLNNTQEKVKSLDDDKINKIKYEDNDESNFNKKITTEKSSGNIVKLSTLPSDSNLNAENVISKDMEDQINAIYDDYVDPSLENIPTPEKINLSKPDVSIPKIKSIKPTAHKVKKEDKKNVNTTTSKNELSFSEKNVDDSIILPDDISTTEDLNTYKTLDPANEKVLDNIGSEI